MYMILHKQDTSKEGLNINLPACGDRDQDKRDLTTEIRIPFNQEVMELSL
jgi:broad specificity polyphosphatase/5'/3'-nucleotidase SurE